MDQFRPFPLNQQTQSGEGLLGLKEKQAMMKGKSTLVKPTREAPAYVFIIAVSIV